MGTQGKEGEVELLPAMAAFLGHCQPQWGSKCRGRHGGEEGVNGGPRAALRHILEGDQLELNPGEGETRSDAYRVGLGKKKKDPSRGFSWDLSLPRRIQSISIAISVEALRRKKRSFWWWWRPTGSLVTVVAEQEVEVEVEDLY
ncbi:hypothetical protein BHE74_00028155 [Ensete ventricosum]|nr:hypothetical protein BHE74_00028155 [Ensete ventricosum]